MTLLCAPKLTRTLKPGAAPWHASGMSCCACNLRNGSVTHTSGSYSLFMSHRSCTEYGCRVTVRIPEAALSQMGCFSMSCAPITHLPLWCRLAASPAPERQAGNRRKCRHYWWRNTSSTYQASMMQALLAGAWVMYKSARGFTARARRQLRCSTASQCLQRMVPAQQKRRRTFHAMFGRTLQGPMKCLFGSIRVLRNTQAVAGLSLPISALPWLGRKSARTQKTVTTCQLTVRTINVYLLKNGICMYPMVETRQPLPPRTFLPCITVPHTCNAYVGGGPARTGGV